MTAYEKLQKHFRTAPFGCDELTIEHRGDIATLIESNAMSVICSFPPCSIGDIMTIKKWENKAMELLEDWDGERTTTD